MTTGITPKGFAEAVAKLRKLEQLQALAPTIKAGGLHAKRYLMKYPARVTQKVEFKSDKQRRYFFWALKKGIIEVPYRRGQSPGSETLGKKWGIKVEHGGLTVRVGNLASYGPLVQDRDRQTAMHRKTGWPTVQDVAEQQGPVIVMMIMKKIRQILEAG
jgi:hypothetical protein